MLNYINNDDLIPNKSISQQNKIAGIDKKSASKNPYAAVGEFVDTSEISEQAKKLFDREKDIDKFKSMVMESLDSPQTEEEIKSIMDSIHTGEYISNEDLAEKILGKENMLSSDLTSIFNVVEEV